MAETSSGSMGEFSARDVRFARLTVFPRAGAHPKLNLLPEERRMFGQLFKDCDTESTGVVTGEAAVKLLQRTHLSEQVLGEV
jgi:hypothetical protein